MKSQLKGSEVVIVVGCLLFMLLGICLGVIWTSKSAIVPSENSDIVHIELQQSDNVYVVCCFIDLELNGLFASSNFSEVLNQAMLYAEVYENHGVSTRIEIASVLNIPSGTYVIHHPLWITSGRIIFDGNGTTTIRFVP